MKFLGDSTEDRLYEYNLISRTKMRLFARDLTLWLEAQGLGYNLLSAPKSPTEVLDKVFYYQILTYNADQTKYDNH